MRKGSEDTDAIIIIATHIHYTTVIHCHTTRILYSLSSTDKLSKCGQELSVYSKYGYEMVVMLHNIEQVVRANYYSSGEKKLSTCLATLT